MSYFENFKQQCLVERTGFVQNNIVTFRGLYWRLTKSKKYSAYITAEQEKMVMLGVQKLKQGFDSGVISKEEAKIYKATLKNISSLYKGRSDFHVIVTGLVSILGFTTMSERSVIPFLPSSPIYFVMFVLALVVMVAVERVNMLAEVAENDELTNIIDAAL
ncbi:MULTISPECIES: hypothetical protein [Pseudomonas]|uniref:hypothetical protein n=1 Tax=Pseudomonas TaxID=286 RepID=UPI000CD592AA|nr:MULTISPECIES: hypothetical protein [Pseudomonas]RBH53618.1 hypothetical protein C3F00_026690 [Pseudomonas sp. MWU13-2860]